MDNRLKEAFDGVRAEEGLKEQAKAFVATKTGGYARARRAARRGLAAVCLSLAVIGGLWLYFAPTAAISIDINPSVELSVNRFDRVVAVDGFNDDGRELADALDIRFMDCGEAVRQVLESETVAALLSDNAVVTIAVTGPQGAQTARILSDMEACTAGRQNAYCYSAQAGEVQAAHEMGLSYGKYRAFLEVQALDPSIAPEQIQAMTMREIRDLIDALSTGGGEKGPENGGKGHGQAGAGNGRRYGWEGKEEGG